MISYNSIRNNIYDVQLRRWKDYINSRSPYTMLKSFYYIETASLFLFLTQRFIKSPGVITSLYIISGVCGAFMVNSDLDIFFYFGVFLVFTKGSFDWADGPLARRLNKTSFFGHALDEYGALLTDGALRLSFIYYALDSVDQLDLFPVMAFLVMVTRFNHFSLVIYQKQAGKMQGNVMKTRDSVVGASESKWFGKCYRLLDNVLDARARSVDFLLLVLVVDRSDLLDLSVLLLTLSGVIVVKAVLGHLACLYVSYSVYKGVR
jgi:phosphatidylglycerophosphate synthase